MNRANFANMEAHVASLVRSNASDDRSSDVTESLCRCKVLTEVMGCGWPEELQARVDALKDERFRKPPAVAPKRSMGFVAMLTASMAGPWDK